MPWKGVSVSEQRQRFLEDYLLNYYSISELAERFSVSRTTAHKWVNRFNQHGQEGYKELSRRPHTCPWQIDQAIVGAPPNNSLERTPRDAREINLVALRGRAAQNRYVEEKQSYNIKVSLSK